MTLPGTVFCGFPTHQGELETMFHEDNALVTRITTLNVVNREFIYQRLSWALAI